MYCLQVYALRYEFLVAWYGSKPPSPYFPLYFKSKPPVTWSAYREIAGRLPWQDGSQNASLTG
jgi:hypothetical protein